MYVHVCRGIYIYAYIHTKQRKKARTLSEKKFDAFHVAIARGEMQRREPSVIAQSHIHPFSFRQIRLQALARQERGQFLIRAIFGGRMRAEINLQDCACTPSLCVYLWVELLMHTVVPRQFHFRLQPPTSHELNLEPLLRM